MIGSAPKNRNAILRYMKLYIVEGGLRNEEDTIRIAYTAAGAVPGNKDTDRNKSAGTMTAYKVFFIAGYKHFGRFDKYTRF